MKKNAIILGILSLVAVISINSCENKVGVVPSASTSSCPPVDTAKLYYSKGIDTIINTQCAVAGCHVVHGTGVNFSTYAALQTDATGGTSSKFYAYLVLGNPMIMPNVPQAGWNDCMKNKLVQWVEKGSPQ